MKEIVDKIEAEAAQYAKDVWNSQEPPQDFIQTRKGKRSFEDYIAGRSKSIERIYELEMWHEQNTIVHEELKQNYLKLFEEDKKKDERIKELEDGLNDLCLSIVDARFYNSQATAIKQAKQLLTKH